MCGGFTDDSDDEFAMVSRTTLTTTSSGSGEKATSPNYHSWSAFIEPSTWLLFFLSGHSGSAAHRHRSVLCSISRSSRHASLCCPRTTFRSLDRLSVVSSEFHDSFLHLHVGHYRNEPYITSLPFPLMALRIEMVVQVHEMRKQKLMSSLLRRSRTDVRWSSSFSSGSLTAGCLLLCWLFGWWMVSCCGVCVHFSLSMLCTLIWSFIILP